MNRIAWRWTLVFHWPKVCRIEMGSHPHFISKRLTLKFGGIWERTRTLDSEDDCRRLCDLIRPYIAELTQRRMDHQEVLDKFDKLNPKGEQASDAC